MLFAVLFSRFLFYVKMLYFRDRYQSTIPTIAILNISLILDPQTSFNNHTPRHLCLLSFPRSFLLPLRQNPLKKNFILKCKCLILWQKEAYCTSVIHHANYVIRTEQNRTEHRFYLTKTI